MEKQNKNERPEVYALRQDGGNWRISRRDFLKAAGIGAAAMGAGLNSGCSQKKPLSAICEKSPAHKNTISGLILSSEGKYLLSLDTGNIIKCWDLEKRALLGSVSRSYGNYAVGSRDGVSCLFLNSGKEQVDYLELPLTEYTSGLAAVEVPYREPITLPESQPTNMAMDSSENFYTSGNGSIRFYRKADGYQQPELLYEPNSKRSNIADIRLFNKEKSLFVLWRQNNGFGVYDMEKRAMSYYDIPCSDYAILPDNKHVLVGDKKKYSLVSLETHANIWEQDSPKPGGGNNYSIAAAEITPDGKTGILIVAYQMKFYLYLISTADGTQLNELALGDLVNSDRFAGPVISKDGTVLTISAGKTILFFSLPDLQLIGCPLDVNEAKNDTKGIEYMETDIVTGETYTTTLPCGAALPSGAVCTCNCVVGRGGCACDGHSKSNRSGGGGGSHYWHPN